MNNMGWITEVAIAFFPGNTGVRPNAIAPLAETLRLNGYGTAAFGKYHEAMDRKIQGRFDATGTSLARNLAKQIARGVVPQETKLAPKPSFIRNRDGRPADGKRLFRSLGSANIQTTRSGALFGQSPIAQRAILLDERRMRSST